MQLSLFIERIKNDLEAVASVGDEHAAEVARRMAPALEPSLRLLLLDVVGEAGRELGAQIPGGRVEIRLEGGDPVVIFVEDTPTPAPAGRDESAEARITLRLPESLKARAEEAAGQEGVSVNTWLVQALGRALEPRRRRPNTRITGYARS